MAGISAKDVKELRDKTGAGMMDCKKALVETDGDLEKAVDYLRKKGLASAGKKAGRLTAEGLVDSYIHFGGQIGVLVEVNCETDFVARNEEFKTLVQDLAKQIAACPNISYVDVSEIPQEIVDREKAIAMESDTLKGKPDNVKEKIVQGKVDKVLTEMCLLNQPYIKDQSMTVDDLIKQAIAKLGENIKVRRYVRFVLGEGVGEPEAEAAEATPTEAPEAKAPEPAKAEPTKKEPAKGKSKKGKSKKAK